MEVKVKSPISLAHLTLNKDLSDVTFKVGTSSDDTWLFPAHKFLLSEASPVFKAMFSGEYIDSKSEVVITDISPRIFYKLILFIYKGEFTILSLSDMIDVVMAADKYQMDKLKSACLEKMRNYKISLEIFWDLLMHFYQFGDLIIPLELKMDLLIFLDANAEAVLKSDNFLFVKREIVSMIISRNTLNVSELVVCAALLDWAKMQCCKGNLEPNAKNKRSVLKEVIYMIRLSTMERRNVLKTEIYKLLTNEEKDAVLRVPISLPKSWNSRARYSKRVLQQKCLLSEFNFKSSLYLVFAKDAYLHEFDLDLNDRRLSWTLTAQSDVGLENIKNSYRAFPTCVKAFVCYRLDFDYSSFTGGKYSSWCYDDEKAVLFTIEHCQVSDLKKFVSPDYWKEVFARDPPVHDDGVVCSTNTYSVGLVIKATFC